MRERLLGLFSRIFLCIWKGSGDEVRKKHHSHDTFHALTIIFEPIKKRIGFGIVATVRRTYVVLVLFRSRMHSMYTTYPQKDAIIDETFRTSITTSY